MRIIREKINVEQISCTSLSQLDYDRNQEIEIFPELKCLKDSYYLVTVHIIINLNKCQLVGKMSQKFKLDNENDKYLLSEEINPSIMDELLQPLFIIFQRLVSDMTEIIFDEPGIKLTFIPENEKN